jgi:hypothetical protein
MGPTKEDQALISGTQGRPANVLVKMWGPSGRDIAFDVVVSSPMQLATMPRASYEVGWTANKAYQEKMRKYGAICRDNEIEMSPLVTDTFGGWAARSAV